MVWPRQSLRIGVLLSPVTACGAIECMCQLQSRVNTSIWSADRDGDGVDDVRDRCPNDPNKTAPGRCGCGEQDATACPDE